MFCALKGATSSPASASRRHSATVITLLPTSEAVPRTASARVTGRRVAAAARDGPSGKLLQPGRVLEPQILHQLQIAARLHLTEPVLGPVDQQRVVGGQCDPDGLPGERSGERE